MTQGSFGIQLHPDAPLSLWTTISEFGHIVIIPQWVDHRLFTDAILLTISRYTGVVLSKTLDEEGLTIEGAGLAWWLGDDEGKGDIIETAITLTSSTLDNALTQLLPVAIQKGTVTEPAGITHSATYQWQTRLEAIRTVCASMGVEYKIRPDGTIDAGPKENIHNYTNPTVVVVRNRLSG